MQPAEIDGHTHVFLPAAGTEDRVEPLKVIKAFMPDLNSYVLISEWEPTPQERQAIANGANIHLHVMGEVMPPAALTVSEPVLLRQD